MDPRDVSEPTVLPVVQLVDGAVVAVVLSGVAGPDALARAASVAAGLRHELGEPMPVWVELPRPLVLDTVRDDLRNALERHGLGPDAVVVGIDEACGGCEPEAVAELVDDLLSLGVHCAITNFGTTVHTLQVLRALPVRHVLLGVGLTGGSPAVLEALVELAHTVGLSTAATGVRDADELRDLQRIGFDLVSGPLFGVVADDAVRLAQPWCGIGIESGDALAVTAAGRVLGGAGPRSQLLRSLLEVVSDAVVVTDASPDPRRNRIVHVNPGFTAQTGFGIDDIRGRSPIALDPPQTNREHLEELFGAMAAGRGTTVETRARRRDGTTFPCRVSATPVRDNAGVVTHWVQVRRDLSEHRVVERERSWFQAVVEHAERGTLLVDHDDLVRYASAAAATLTGAEPLDLVGRSVGDLLPLAALDSTDPDASWELLPIKPGLPVPVALELRTLELDGLEGVRAVTVTDLRPRLRRSEMASLAAEFAAETLQFDLLSPSWTERLTDLLRRVVSVLGVEYALVDLLDDARRVLVPLASYHRGVEGSWPVPPAVPYDRVPAWVAQLHTGAALYRTGAEGDRPDWLQDRIGAFAGDDLVVQANVPLRAGDQVLGVLSVHHRGETVRDWSDDDRRFLERIGDTVAQLVLRVRTVQEVVAREAELSAVLASVTDVLFVVDRDGRLGFVSDAVLSLGFRPEDLAGESLGALVHADDVGFLTDLLAGSDQAGGKVSLRVRLVTADGSWRWFEANLGDARTVAGWLVACRDIDDKVLEEAEEAYRSALDALVLDASQQVVSYGASGFVAQLDLLLTRLGETMAVDCAWLDLVDEDSGVLRNMAGWTVAELEGLTSGELGDETMQRGWLEFLQEASPVVVADAEYDDAYLLARADFPVLPARSTITTAIWLKDTFGGVLGVAHVDAARDWTDAEVNAVQTLAGIVSAAIATHRLDLALRENESKFRRLSDQATELVTTIDPTGRISYMSAAAETILGWPSYQMVGTVITDWIHPSEHERLPAVLATIAWNHKAVEEFRFRHSDGTHRWLSCSLSALKDRLGRVLEVRVVADEVRGDGSRFETVDADTSLPDRVEIERQVELLGGDDGVGLILLDIALVVPDDVFEPVEIGAEVLKPLGERIIGRLRGTDVLGRVAEHTLAVVCPGADGAGLGVLTRRLVEWIADEDLTLAGGVVVRPEVTATSVAGAAGMSGRVLVRAGERALLRRIESAVD
jgi:PAS domain S-box-containing protein